LAVRVDESGGDELAALGRDFNAMTASLGRQRVALEDAGHQLAEREALAAIGRATAVIAHELKNPLGILLGAAGIVANPARPEEARRQAGQIIDEEVRRLERTLRGLLEYARPRPPEKVAVDALALCRTAAERSTLPGAPAEGCAVGVSGSLAQALADASQVEQVLLNLIANAAQAGARKIAITVGCASSRVSVEVADDGPGIAAEIRDQLFRPFVTTKQRGAGLGLAGSRRMARDNGGDLRHLPSESGARFVLELAQANAPGATTGPTTQGATPR
jgi:signal transduction histidine kinase